MSKVGLGFLQVESWPYLVRPWRRHWSCVKFFSTTRQPLRIIIAHCGRAIFLPFENGFEVYGAVGLSQAQSWNMNIFGIQFEKIVLFLRVNEYDKPVETLAVGKSIRDERFWIARAVTLPGNEHVVHGWSWPERWYVNITVTLLLSVHVAAPDAFGRSLFSFFPTHFCPHPLVPSFVRSFPVLFSAIMGKKDKGTESLFTKEEEQLLSDFSRNVSTKSSALFYGSAFMVSALPICEFH